MALTRHGGRIGLVLPSGVATDAGSTPPPKAHAVVVRVDALVGFENQRAHLPDSPQRSFRAPRLPRAGSRPGASRAVSAKGTCACSTNLDERAIRRTNRHALRRRSLRVSPRTTSPFPIFGRTSTWQIVERAAALFRPLGATGGWSARFGRELNATDDRPSLHEGRAGLPVVEGKHIEPFRVNAVAARYRIAPARARRRITSGAIDRGRLCYRDVAGASNRMTLIAAILPARMRPTHTVFCLRTPLDDAAQHFLCGLFNSFVVNYFVRLRVGTHVTTEVIEGLPIPSRSECGDAFDEIAHIARLLSRRPNPAAAAHLNAAVARLYQLTAGEFRYVVGTFPLVAQDERDAAFAAYVAAEQGQ